MPSLRLNHITSKSHNLPCIACHPIHSSLKYLKFFMASSFPSNGKLEADQNVMKPFMPRGKVLVQVTHPIPQEKIEIFKSMESWVEKNILKFLKTFERSWQPQDFRPDASSDGFDEQVKELRERATEIQDDYFVSLVGDMITENALPTYLSLINTLEGVRDETCASLSSWAIWKGHGQPKRTDLETF